MCVTVDYSSPAGGCQIHTPVVNSAVQSQKVVSSHLLSEQILYFGLHGGVVSRV